MRGHFQRTICNTVDKRCDTRFAAKIGDPPASWLGEPCIKAGETMQHPLAVADNDTSSMQRGFLTLCNRISHALSLGVKVIVNRCGFEVPCLEIDASLSCEGEKLCIICLTGEETTCGLTCELGINASLTFLMHSHLCSFIFDTNQVLCVKSKFPLFSME
ncbi:hypothetical protein NDU88_001975 [Pleurodeles waltl]|uniref:Uncharacterized protein n=1 Tax=Pleurodeles waltl TaxID=8319 RepID=A0AAV7P7G4_PLEWA|nr:hypothetical protein NDU88_001975 [Pleurodeles waltl]